MSSGKIVCVTGGSGYIASWLVKLLLQRGYTVRDLDDPKKTEHLRALDGAAERLHLFKANILEENSFDAGIEGCDGVFHTASSFYQAVTDPQQWYVLSKTLAEDAAWKFAKENAIDIVTINPAMVIGPLLLPTLNTSAVAILNLINGSTSYPNASFGWVNVKDVAMAHILAFEVPSASGRYCLVERVVHYSELVRIIRELYPSLPVPEKCADDKPFVPIYQVSKEKYKSLGLDYTPIETSIKETIESLEENFVNFLSF
ncbi:phenylacetaldehyde reductase-like isoform X2 [Zingiber officinale]|uniref:phenylacetaldehyde reductase-like isoform X2 n=1 Tax=Zingiber officinale TaxID=94328 RepID=UPI001C4B7E6A|nr:phenylacetaldehyde reductase-like isoform X2 [Zingiber officinale]